MQILAQFHHYNSENSVTDIFGLDTSITYDALVVAPSFTPEKVLDDTFSWTLLREAPYTAGYFVQKGDKKIAWVKVASGASNLLDHLLICLELKFKLIFFVGAVGALKPEFQLGDLCTPSYSISGVGANAYLCDKLTDYKPFEKVTPNDEKFVEKCLKIASKHGIFLKKSSVFCTDSIATEYLHLSEIKAFDTDLIEMETSTLYLLAREIGIPTIALLVVSDNSACGIPLVGRTEEQKAIYQISRGVLLPRLIWSILQSY